MNIPRYSVIIPVYKAEAHIPRLIDCLKAQTDPDFEAIFVNDCSPDNSAAVIQACAEQDPRIRLFHQPRNMRQGAARNRGLEEARGEFILFADADDGFAPNYLERMHQVITDNNADLALCNPVFEYEQHSMVVDSFSKTPHLQQRLFSRDELLLSAALHWGVGDFFYRIEPWGKMIRHSLISHYKLRFHGMFSEDVAFSVSLACVAPKTIAIRDALYLYNKRGESDLTRYSVEYSKHFHEHHFYIREFMNKFLPHDKAKYFFSLFAICSFFPGLVSFKKIYSLGIDNKKYNDAIEESFIEFIKNVDIDFFDKNTTLNKIDYIKKLYIEDGFYDLFKLLINRYKYSIYRGITDC